MLDKALMIINCLSRVLFCFSVRIPVIKQIKKWMTRGQKMKMKRYMQENYITMRYSEDNDEKDIVCIFSFLPSNHVVWGSADS
jgi:hypothetical protein